MIKLEHFRLNDCGATAARLFEDCVNSVRERLNASPYSSIRHLQCVPVDSQVIHIRGEVPSFYLKQMVQSSFGSSCGPFQLLHDVSVQHVRPKAAR